MATPAHRGRVLLVAFLASLLCGAAARLWDTPSGEPDVVQRHAAEFRARVMSGLNQGNLGLGQSPRLTSKHAAHAAHAVPDQDGQLRYNEEHNYTWALLLPTGYEHHASQLLVYYDSDDPQRYSLLCAWFSGVEGEHVDIAYALLARDATGWTRPVLAARGGHKSLQNPVWLWDRPVHEVRLMFTSQSGHDQGTSHVEVAVKDTTAAAGFGRPEVLFEQPGAFLKNAPLLAADNSTWLLPMYHTPRGFHDAGSQWSQMLRSADGGRTWGEGVIMAPQGMGLVQPTVTWVADGTAGEKQLVAFFRSRAADNVWRAVSRDDGRSWSAPERTVLPQQNKAIQCITLDSGAIALVFDNNRGMHDCQDGWGCTDSKMYPMSIGLSLDGGITWPYVRDLEEHFDQRLEYSYPSIKQTADGKIHITYTWSLTRRRVAIRYMQVTEGWIRGAWDWGTTRGWYQPSAAA
eukprot:jgi/Tetstr1/465604/TSEL_010251.t1